MKGDELKARMAALPKIDENRAPPHTWPRHQLSIRRHTANDDPYRFLCWSTMAATMFVGTGAAFTQKEFDTLTPRYRKILPEPFFGQPKVMAPNGGSNTSGNLIHQAYHLQRLENKLGIGVELIDNIIEFGGGYGAMVLLCRRLGFTGTYTIIDLPEFSLLQEFYLSNIIGLQNIELVSDWDSGKMQTDLLMAIYSLSEVSIAYRLQVLNSIEAKYHFLAYQDLYTLPNGEQIDNIAEFKKIAQQFDLECWRNEIMGGHWYAV